MTARWSWSERGALVVMGLLAVAASGCGARRPAASGSAPPRALVLAARPVGAGARFHPPATGPVPGPCRRRLGPRNAVHVELFAADRVVIVAAGIGTRPPRRLVFGRVANARCYGELVTLDPTGLVLVRRGVRLDLAALFRAWGEPLSARGAASFTDSRVAVFVDGRRWQGSSGDVPLAVHAEIVVEVGAYVPPHSSYAFPPGV